MHRLTFVLWIACVSVMGATPSFAEQSPETEETVVLLEGRGDREAYIAFMTRIREGLRTGDPAITETMRRVLDHRSSHARWRAVELLSRNAPDPTEFVARGLRDPDLAVRQAAVSGLRRARLTDDLKASLGQLTLANPPLLSALCEVDGGARFAVPQLINLLDNPNHNVRHHAALTLAAAGEAAAPAVPRLIDWLDDGTEPARNIMPAVKVFRAVGERAEAAVPAMIRQYDSPRILIEGTKKHHRHALMLALASTGASEEHRPAVMARAYGLLEDLEMNPSGAGLVLKRLATKEDLPKLIDLLGQFVETGDTLRYRAVLSVLLPFGRAAADAIPAIDGWLRNSGYLLQGAPEEPFLFEIGLEGHPRAVSLAVTMVRHREWVTFDGPLIEALTEVDLKRDLINEILDLADQSPGRNRVAGFVASELALRAAKNGNQADRPRLERALTRVRGVPAHFGCRTGEPASSPVRRIAIALETLGNGSLQNVSR